MLHCTFFFFKEPPKQAYELDYKPSFTKHFEMIRTLKHNLPLGRIMNKMYSGFLQCGLKKPKQRVMDILS